MQRVVEYLMEVSKEAKKMADEITLLVAAEINVGRPEKLAVLCDAYLKDGGYYKHALERIRDECGGVCTYYEVCTHKACRDSYSAWAFADKALKGEKV